MKKYFSNFLVFSFFNLIVLTFVACNNSDSESFLISFDIHNSEQLPFSEIAEKIRIIELSLPENQFVSEFGLAKMYNNYFFISTKGNPPYIFVFDSLGNFKNRIGNFGKGPGEYQRITSFLIDTGSEYVEILSLNDQKKITYDFDGNFVNEDNHPRWGGEAFEKNEGDYVVYYGFLKWVSDYLLKIFDALTLHEKFKAIEVPDNQVPFLQVVDLFNFSEYNNELLFWHAVGREIYSISEGTFRKKYQIDFGSNNIPENILKKNFNNVKEFFDEVWGKGYGFLMGGAGETERYLIMRGSKSKAFYHFIYDKKEDKKYVFDRFFDDLLFHQVWDIDFTGLTLILVKDNKLYFTIPGNDLYKLIQNFNPTESYEQTHNYRSHDFLGSVSEMDHPYLVEITLKK